MIVWKPSIMDPPVGLVPLRPYSRPLPSVQKHTQGLTPGDGGSDPRRRGQRWADTWAGGLQRVEVCLAPGAQFVAGREANG